ncbi:VapA/VapB family virulence-associated protein [Xenorhabdus innexi]|nr:VapA/VapB family virulence-associated protein [Xenorhabdus innexi]
MSKILYIESDSYLPIENGLKIIESLSEKTEDRLDDKVRNIDDSILSLSGLKTTKYHADFVITSYIGYFEIRLSIDGGKTFYGRGGGLGSLGKGWHSGDFYILLDDINKFYEKATTFVGAISFLKVNVSFFESPLDTLGIFDGYGVGTVSATVTGAGHWE